jgi:tetratricopeptide (TPR) repeat protein
MPTQTTSRNRAFLSHATPDKAFVHKVEARLGKQRVVVDEREFATGADFVDAIRKALFESQLFVLFASKASLASLWVKFEIAESDELLRSDILKGALVFIIDNETMHGDLPRWMQRGLISRTSQPNSAARIIEYQLSRLTGARRKPLFLGRAELIQEVTSLLIPSAGDAPPHLLLVSGLPDTGRRTFVKNAFKDLLSIETFVVIALRNTDSIDTLHLHLLDELGSLDTRAQYIAAREIFQGSELADRAKIIAEMIASCCLDNSAVIIVDDGALLDSTGKYTDEAWALLKSLKEFPYAYLSLIHLRRPNASSQDIKSINAAYIRVPPVSPEATVQLLSQQLRQVSVSFSDHDIDELAFYVKGFPPSISIAVSLIKERGLALVKADKSMLVGLQTHTFTALLNDLAPSDLEWRILSFLAAGLDLPFDGIVTIINDDAKVAADAINRLIDLNLVQFSEEGYSISGPIRFAVQAIKGYLSDGDYALIAKRLKDRFWNPGDELPSLQIIDSTISASLRSDSGDEDFRSLIIPSALFRAAKGFYDLRGHDSLVKSRKLLQKLLDLEPKDRKALNLLCKIQARLGEFDKARQLLDRIRAERYSEQYFLSGFLLWKERKYREAVTAFRTAIAREVRGFEVYHGLGSCLFRLQLLDEAERAIDDGSRNRKPNKMLVDLAAQIAIERGDYKKAEDFIEQLLILKADADFHHRKATLLNKQGKYRAALPHAREAAADFSRLFEAETVLIDTLAELGEFDEANQKLDDLQRREKHQRDRRDIVLGLRCKIWLRQGNWRQAESMAKEMENKTSDYYIGLMVEILTFKVADLSLSPGARAEGKAELDLYSARLTPSSASITSAAEESSAVEDSSDELAEV